jgi:hypothetical protein
MALNDTPSKKDADSIMTKETYSVPSESPRSLQEHQDYQDHSAQRSSSPEFDPKAGENRLRPAGGKQYPAQPLMHMLQSLTARNRYHQSHYLGFSF